jgi:octaprenyl-diphosphate synthase
VLGEAATEQRKLFAQYGQHLGMAFQIVDDVLDYTATDGRWGKNVGNDLARGKQTLPLIRTFEMATQEEREALAHQLNNGREMNKVFPIIEKYQGIEYSHEKAFEYLEQADGIIPRFNIDSASQMFKSINRFVAERTH